MNGRNGIGKSSLFMDAVIDCIYENPREGNITGWICNGIDAKSGLIRFRFSIGDVVYEIVKTRMKSGKGRLVLMKEINGEMRDISETKMADTQHKIVSITSMDLETFKVCVMIMQDNYGLFLEADKTEHMRILSNTLGLGIYGYS